MDFKNEWSDVKRLPATQIFPRQNLGSFAGGHLGRGEPRHEEEEDVTESF